MSYAPLRNDPEKLKAHQYLTHLASPFRFRILRDAEGYPVIPGRYGRIEWHAVELLAVYSDRPYVFKRIWAIPGVMKHQTCDWEMRALFPPEVLPQVAKVIQARRRRTLSPEAARKLGANTAYSATLTV